MKYKGKVKCEDKMKYKDKVKIKRFVLKCVPSSTCLNLSGDVFE